MSCEKHEISTNEAKELAQKYNITAIPTIIIKKENMVKKLVGGYPAEKLIEISPTIDVKQKAILGLLESKFKRSAICLALCS